MEMRAELVARGHDFQDSVAQLLGIERAYPDPVDRRALGDHLEQRLEADRRIEVASVAAKMNAGQDDLAKARGRQRSSASKMRRGSTLREVPREVGTIQKLQN